MRKLLLILPVILGSILLAAEIPAFESWDQYLGGSDSLQYSSLKQINKSNVKQLEVAWTYEVGGYNPMVFGPTVVDGTMFVYGANALVALDAATGKEIWRHPGAT